MSDSNPRNIVFLCSGGGGNLRFIHQAIRSGSLGVTIGRVFADRPCGALDYAAQNGISCQVHDFSPAGQLVLTQALLDLDPVAIVSTVNKILIPGLVQAFSRRVINLHYSLLPSFGGSIGTQPVRQAVEYGTRLVGVTAHFVDEGLDTGQPIIQAAFARSRHEPAEAAMETMFRSGCLALLAALSEIAGDNNQSEESIVLSVAGKSVLFSSGHARLSALNEESIWSGLVADPAAN